MKSMIITISLVIVGLTAPAQTKLSRIIPLSGAEKINMRFDYPELVRVSTWDRNEIAVEGTVSINQGENDDAFVFDSETNARTINLNAYIKDMKGLPQQITILQGGQQVMFKDKAALKAYEKENGKNYTSISWGPNIDIVLEIKVPKNVLTRVESVYGLVEVKNFQGPLQVEATYGGIDAALSERGVGEVIAETNFGEIFTNLDAKFLGEQTEKDFHTYVSAKPGNGPRYDFESKFGNVYIRKQN